MYFSKADYYSFWQNRVINGNICEKKHDESNDIVNFRNIISYEKINLNGDFFFSKPSNSIIGLLQNATYFYRC